MRYIQIIIGIILTSFYIFPVRLLFFPLANTKLTMAIIGLCIWGINIAKGKSQMTRNEYISLFVFAFLISLTGFFSVTINETPDYAYATYLISMAVWLCAAYLLCKYLLFVHKELHFKLICKYVIAVCVIQCILAIIIDNNIAISNFVDTCLDTSFMKERKRLYGFGATLDTAGGRFSIALLMIICLALDSSYTKSRYNNIILALCFLVLLVIGNIISRTTTVGVVIALAYSIMIPLTLHKHNSSAIKFWSWLSILVICAIPFIIYYYQTDAHFQQQIRFGFEGFFSLVENHTWEVGSNIQLSNMIVFPDNLKTWIIGDGYFNNPDDIDALYIGEEVGGYYKGTDIGYLRFIFYFGLIGLFAFILYIYSSMKYCIKRYDNYKLFFIGAFLINLIIWFKVATDMFFIFALFLVASIFNQIETQNESNQQ